LPVALLLELLQSHRKPNSAFGIRHSAIENSLLVSLKKEAAVPHTPGDVLVKLAALQTTRPAKI
jgi:hypothetical protein